MTVCDRCRKELHDRVVIRRCIRIFGNIIFSEDGILCKECWNDFKRFITPITTKPSKEKDDEKAD